ncbi:MAG: DUF2090 domain-containing protein [Candidatus Buchananbacteria bacterium]|nr:DUF2090 domain-containing protein [Candidatus Buchananbacteria bacterium]
MDKPLLILPFDHRSSFSKDILGLEGELNQKQKKEISNLKKIIFEAFVIVRKKYKADDYFGILVDEEYGLSIIRQAQKIKIIVCLPVEKSGQSELQFEYGKYFGSHIKKINPDYVKVLVRYNPLNKQLNKKQLVKLKELDYFCRKNNYKVMLELLESPTAYDLKMAKSGANYNNTLRLARTTAVIEEIRNVLKVDIWKLEYFTKKGWQKVIKVVGQKSKIILLGGGEDKAVVDKWIKDASKFDQIIGFAIGRTIFLNELKKYVAGKITKKEAIKLIADNFDYFVKLWAKNKGINL